MTFWDVAHLGQFMKEFLSKCLNSVQFSLFPHSLEHEPFLKVDF